MPTRPDFGSTHPVNSRFRTVHVRICVPFPNAPITQSPRCPLDPSKAAAPSASNAALETPTHQKHKAAAALLLHQHALHSNPRETGMLAKLIAQPHDHRHPRSQSVSRKTNIMVPYTPIRFLQIAPEMMYSIWHILEHSNSPLSMNTNHLTPICNPDPMTRLTQIPETY